MICDRDLLPDGSVSHEQGHAVVKHGMDGTRCYISSHSSGSLHRPIPKCRRMGSRMAHDPYTRSHKRRPGEEYPSRWCPYLTARSSRCSALRACIRKCCNRNQESRSPKTDNPKTHLPSDRNRTHRRIPASSALPQLSTSIRRLDNASACGPPNHLFYGRSASSAVTLAERVTKKPFMPSFSSARVAASPPPSWPCTMAVNASMRSLR